MGHFAIAPLARLNELRILDADDGRGVREDPDHAGPERCQLGRNRVSVETPTGRLSVDLRGVHTMTNRLARGSAQPRIVDRILTERGL
jgi:hypothetical protein